jgi:hypothetical protein
MATTRGSADVSGAAPTRAEPRWPRPLGPPPARTTTILITALAALTIIGGMAELDPWLTFAVGFVLLAVHQLDRKRRARATGASSTDEPWHLRVIVSFCGAVVFVLVMPEDLSAEPWMPAGPFAIVAAVLVAEMIWWTRRARR